MTDYSYLFRQFEDSVVNPDDANDAVVKEIKSIAEKNGLTVKFNKIGQGGGAAVMPPRNQAIINLDKGRDNKWRVLL